jgi:hypothetical protein
MGAYETFQKLETGILNIVRAADIYAIYIIHKMRQQPISQESIDVILKGDISGLNLIGDLYKPEELRELQEQGHMREIAQQILVATHTALEVYLKAKFDEYYNFRFKKRFSAEQRSTFRSIQDAKRMYRRFFEIHLNLLEFQYYSTNRCNFAPNSCWEAILTIDAARHEIVHGGVSTRYQMDTIMDSWYPFEFVRRWVQLFNFNFDAYIYRGEEYPLVRKHNHLAETKNLQS